MNVDPALKREQEAFEAQLDELLKQHRGQFVLFKDGRPVEFFPDHATAYSRALELFGIDATFLIAAVAKSEPRPISVAWDAGIMFEDV